MELAFTAEQDELRAAMRAVLAKERSVTLARAVTDGSGSADVLWRTLAGLGWPALTVPARHGGVGLGAVEAAILAEELGRALTPGPLLATATQFVPALRACGDDEQQARFLGAVATGSQRGSLAVAEATGSFDPADTTATMARVGDAVVLTGEKRYVVDGDAVDEVVVVARAPGSTGDDGVGAVVVPVAALRPVAVRALDGARRVAHLPLDGVRVGVDRVLDGASAAALRRVVEEAAAAVALETVGTAQQAFDVTLAHAMQREQFGVPIGSFQAVKHKFADMLVALERARSTGYVAALTIAEDDPRRRAAVSVAKVAAGDAQRLVAKEGIQLHGGVGFTWEHDMHLYVRRMKSNEPLFGTSQWHRAVIADTLGV